MRLRSFTVGVAAAAMLAVPAASASAAEYPVEIPPVHCGIVSCTYQVEQAIETAGGLVEDVVECGKDTVVAYWRALNGMPQGYYCEFG